MNNRLQAIVDKYGPWTAMSIKLSSDIYTREQAPDHRLKRILQVCSDLSRKPLSACRVLDLACLEGHYGIEFACHGSEVVGIEGREASVAKCEFAARELGLTNAKFYQDDVRNLTVEKYGMFDIIICSGLIYHLPAQDAWKLIQSMHSVCQGIVVIDTFVALSSQISVEIDGNTYHGHVYKEHDETDSDEEKNKKLWASLDNNASFWFTVPSLMNLLSRAGYSSSFDVMTPNMPGNFLDRKTYVAIKKPSIRVLTSDLTDRYERMDIAEGINSRFDPSQIRRGKLFKTAKQLLPQSVKNAIKPTLRLFRLLPPDNTPWFLRRDSKD